VGKELISVPQAGLFYQVSTPSGLKVIFKLSYWIRILYLLQFVKIFHDVWRCLSGL